VGSDLSERAFWLRKLLEPSVVDERRAVRSCRVSVVRGLMGLLAFAGIAWLLSENRRRVRPKTIAIGFGVQIIVAAIVLKVGPVRALFSLANGAVVGLQRATESGTALVFGYLGGAPSPFKIAEDSPQASTFVLGFRALPIILVISAVTSLLVYWRILPRIIQAFSSGLSRAFGISGAASLGTAANIFVGMVEGPIFIRPYLSQLSRSDLFVLMTAGMATIAGTVLVLYAQLLEGVVSAPASHLLAASIMSAPAAVTMALIMVPSGPRGESATPPQRIDRGGDSAMDALTQGIENGLKIVLSVAASLIVLVSLVAIVNALLGLLPDVNGGPLALERVFGWVLSPIAWLMGIPWGESQTAGSLLGTKVALNELLAYVRLSQLASGSLSEHSRLIMTYGLCGFANFGSLGIMLGGLASLAPTRRKEAAELGLRSILAGTLATCCTGAIVGVLGP